ncbi:MAG: phosphoribosyltransferase family protein [Candidatus Thorarchaeota archaeon]|jgi:ribose-phosphate pyrophosphokinase
MKDFDVVLASGALHLQRFFDELGYKTIIPDMNYDGRRFFPNAELYARLSEVPKVSNRDVVVVQSCTGSSPERDEMWSTADRLVELLLFLEILNHPLEVEKVGHKTFKYSDISPPSNVDVILTFQPFALQDKSFLIGEAISGKWAVEQILEQCRKLSVVNPHADPRLEWVKQVKSSGRYQVIDVMEDLIQFAAKKFGFEDYCVVAPDEGAQARYHVEGFGKYRTDSYTVELSGDLDVKGRNAIVIDDLTKSGSTLLKAADRLRDLGASDVGMAVVHAVPLRAKGEKLLERLLDKVGDRIVTSNSVYTHLFCEQNKNITFNIIDKLVEFL